MWFLLVTTVTTALLADAGYLYNAPRTPLRLPNRYSVSARSVHRLSPRHNNMPRGVRHEEKPISYPVSYKDYVYIKHGNAQHSNDYTRHMNPHVHNVASVKNRGFLQSQMVHSNIGDHSNIRYTTHSTVPKYYQHYVPMAPTVRVHSYHPIATSTATIGTNIAYSPVPQSNKYNLIANNAHFNQIHGSRFSGSAVQTSHVDANQNNDYNQAVISSDSTNYNRHPQITQVASVDNPHYSISQVSSHGNIVNHGQIDTAEYNEDYGQSGLATSQADATYNNQIKQVNKPHDHRNNENFVSQIGFNPYSEYSHNFTPLPNTDFNNEFLHTSSLVGTDVNTAFEQNFTPAIDINLIGAQNHALSSPGNINIDTGYAQSSSYKAKADSGAILAPTETISSIEHSEELNGPTHIDLNSSVLQSLSSSVAVVNDDIAPTLRAGGDNLDLNNVAVGDKLVNPPVSPIIHKHIYFHVPPPELEEPQKVVPTPPPKKHYKIVFIKVPSQESRSNSVHLQQQIAKVQNAASEDKTLIYVLVKNSEGSKSSVPVVESPKPSKHEVFFVKYNGSPFDIASQVNEELEKTGSVESIVPLEPGLINGRNE